MQVKISDFCVISYEFYFSGVELDDKKVGVAVPDSVCSERAVAVVKVSCSLFLQDGDLLTFAQFSKNAPTINPHILNMTKTLSNRTRS